MKTLSVLKSAVTALALSAFLVPAAFAADNEDVQTSNRSKNPVTGTVTDTREAKHKRTHRDGTVSESKTKDKTKYKTDGTVENKSEAEQIEEK